MADKVPEKLGKLLAALEELQRREMEITTEMQALVSGKPGIGAQLKEAEREFSDLWRARYGAPYLFAYVKDRPQLKRLIGNVGLEELKPRILRYLRNNDPYYAKARHGFGLFVATFNQHAQPADAAQELELEGDAPADCKHSPRCRDDAEHTRRRMEELRS